MKYCRRDQVGLVSPKCAHVGAKRKEISEEIRERVVRAYQSRKSHKIISRRLKLHPSSLRQIIYKWRTFSMTATQPKSRCPLKIPLRNIRKMTNQVKANLNVTSRELQTSLAASEKHVYASVIIKKT